MNSLYFDDINIKDFGFTLQSCEIGFPQPKTNYVSIPGRNGDVDLTGLFGVRYEDRVVKIKLICLEDGRKADQLIERLQKVYQGKSTKITHRVQTGEGYSQITVNGRVWLTDRAYDGRFMTIAIEGKASVGATYQNQPVNRVMALNDTVTFDSGLYGATPKKILMYCKYTNPEGVVIKGVDFTINGVRKVIGTDLTNGQWTDVTSWYGSALIDEGNVMTATFNIDVDYKLTFEYDVAH